MTDTAHASIVEHFRTLENPRIERTKKHNLLDILVIIEHSVWTVKTAGSGRVQHGIIFCCHGWPGGQSVAVSSVRSGQGRAYSSIADGYRVIVLRPHGRAGRHPCQAGSLGAMRESDRFPGSDHLRGVFFRRPRGVECRKTCGRGAKRTQILGMGRSTLMLALGQGCPAC